MEKDFSIFLVIYYGIKTVFNRTISFKLFYNFLLNTQCQTIKYRQINRLGLNKTFKKFINFLLKHN